MLFKKVLLAIAVSGLAEVALAQGFGNQDQQNQGQQDQNQQNQDQQNQGQVSTTAAQGNQAASTAASNAAQATGGAGGANGESQTLNADALQTGSESDGQGANESGVKTGQAPAATDNANFINFCSGKTLTNGLQVKGGSCNGIPMGDIPATTNMVSTIITNPAPGDDLEANQDFNVQLQVANLQAGKFTNPDVTYYTAPQQLNQQGNIIGHVHVTIQTLGNDLKPQAAPDGSTFVFFKGIDDAGDGNGGLQAAVAGGLPAGNYRVCTMSAAMNHQPVNMPVAQRGAQDDCTKFTVGQGNGGNGGNGGNDGNGGNGAGDQQGGQQGDQQGGQQQGGATTTAAQGDATTTAAQGGATTTAAQDGQQAATTQAGQGDQQATTTQAAQGSQTTAAQGGNNQFGGNQFGGDQGQGGFGDFGQGRRRQYQWGPRRHRFENRPYVA